MSTTTIIAVCLMFMPMLLSFMYAWIEETKKNGKLRFDYYIAKPLAILLVITGIGLAVTFYIKLHRPKHTYSTSTIEKTYAAKPTDPSKRYWINNKTRKTHNYTCQYYLNCDGHYSSTGSGNDCLICGGAM
ncbi:MAG: hypothetical protein IJA63_05920 [Akkermansia sp.]|nr:hypothetical protein [Akkermansia sp.]